MPRNKVIRMSSLNRSVGKSSYHKIRIQPYHIFSALRLNPWRAELVKRILRDKGDVENELDMDKCIHVANYLLEFTESDFYVEPVKEINLEEIRELYNLSDVDFKRLILATNTKLTKPVKIESLKLFIRYTERSKSEFFRQKEGK